MLNLAINVKKSKKIDFKKSSIIFRHQNRVTREIVESYCIAKNEGAFSDYSILLYNEEINALNILPPLNF